MSNIFKKIVERIFPAAPDFFGMLQQQIDIISQMGDLLLDFMESGNKEVGNAIIEKENEADVLRHQIIQTLNEAFSTPVDREDIYRAVMGIEDIANYCKATIQEMDAFGIRPNKYDLEMAVRLRDGIKYLQQGFKYLATSPGSATECCNSARKEERRIENIYKQALVELFEGTDYNYILKRREVYRHISNLADRLTSCSNNLQDIVVKIM